jgi:hypothetical protein
MKRSRFSEEQIIAVLRVFLAAVVIAAYAVAVAGAAIAFWLLFRRKQAG